MRFAGSAPITDFLNSSINMGGIAQAGAESRSKLKNAGTQMEGELGATGISADGRIQAAEITGAAQASAANAQAQGSMFSALGQVAGAGIGAIPTGFNYGKTKIGAGGGEVGGYGTLGPNYGIYQG